MDRRFPATAGPAWGQISIFRSTSLAPALGSDLDFSSASSPARKIEI